MKTSKVTLSAAVLSNTATSKKVKWTSSNPKVASVSGNGIVTGKSAGTAIIMCTALDGSKVIASCNVSVTPIYPEGIKMSRATLQLAKEKAYLLHATIMPSNTDYKTITWTSSDPTIVTVDSKGKIKGLAAGTAVIAATTTNGLSASCTVTIK